MARQQYMKQYQVWHKEDPSFYQTESAVRDKDARYKAFLDLSESHPSIRYIDMRSRMVGVLFAIGQVVPMEERKKLEILRHALGLKDPIGEGTSYRNYYALYRNSDDFALCASMCEGKDRLPLMGSTNMDKLAEGLVYFHVTITGWDFVNKRRGMSTVETLN